MIYNYLILSCLILLLKLEFNGASKKRFGFATAETFVNINASITTEPTTHRTNAPTTAAALMPTFKTNKINDSGIIRMVRNEKIKTYPKITRASHAIEAFNKLVRPNPKEIGRSGNLQKIDVKKFEMDSIIDNIFRNMNKKGVNPAELDEQEFKNAMGRAMTDMGDTKEMNEYIKNMDENMSDSNENIRDIKENTRETEEMGEDLSKIYLSELDAIKLLDLSEENRNQEKPIRNKNKNTKDLKQNNDKTKFLNNIRQKIKTASSNMPTKKPITISENSMSKKPMPTRNRPKNVRQSYKKQGKPKNVIKMEFNDNIKRLERYLQSVEDLEYEIDPRDALNFAIR